MKPQEMKKTIKPALLSITAIIIFVFMLTSFKNNTIPDKLVNVEFSEDLTGGWVCGGTDDCGTTRERTYTDVSCKKHWSCLWLCEKKYVVTITETKRCATGFPNCEGGNAHKWDETGSSGRWVKCN
ncbi:hypothetical protein [Aquimarina megaterium]|uniref:hypothetical protein n=1 Tax=Aquimarina megaterium TaxID=1443666 RepID=UPI000470189A|nr:hypothetical protein [Aquimarina megaterium]